LLEHCNWKEFGSAHYYYYYCCCCCCIIVLLLLLYLRCAVPVIGLVTVIIIIIINNWMIIIVIIIIINVCVLTADGFLLGGSGYTCCLWRVCMYVCKGWARTHPALQLSPTRSVALTPLKSN
jgi:hypothetical protein